MAKFVQSIEEELDLLYFRSEEATNPFFYMEKAIGEKILLDMVFLFVRE